MSESMERYAKANEEFKEAIASIKETAENLRKAGDQLLKDPFNVSVANVGPGIPGIMGLSIKNQIDGRNWPTGEMLAQKIFDLHSKKLAAERLWDSLSSTEKKSMIPPDSSVSRY
jgi:hypothetical protein